VPSSEPTNHLCLLRLPGPVDEVLQRSRLGAAIVSQLHPAGELVRTDLTNVDHDGNVPAANVLRGRRPRSRLGIAFPSEREGGRHVRHVALTVNGMRHELELEPRELLVYVLRERLGLTGTNVGCDTSACGACTVLLEGDAVKACTVLGVQADGMEITTIEGLARNGELHPVQQAFHEHHALQCGYCTPGMVLTAVSLIESGEASSEAAIRHGLEGNLCRCTGYHNIVRAVEAAAGEGVR
jgi:carbon-monoxide dehydrogenase small subunit